MEKYKKKKKKKKTFCSPANEGKAHYTFSRKKAP